MIYPVDTPDWLEPVVDNLDEHAAHMLRTADNAERARGFYMAVAQLKDEINNQAKLVEEKRLKNLREMKVIS